MSDRTNRFVGSFVTIWIFGLMGVFVGCSTNITDKASDGRRVNSAPAGSGDASSLEDEYWQVMLHGNTRVGYKHSKTVLIREDGRDLLSCSGEMEMRVQRGSEISEMKMELSSVESPTGDLVRFTSKTIMGPVPKISKGTYDKNAEKLLIDLVTPRGEQSVELAWQKGWGGFFTGENSLNRNPMNPGEVRSFQSLEPLSLQVAETHLKALQYETTRLLSGDADLLKIQMTVDLGGGNALMSYLWTEKGCRILKETVPQLGIEVYRTTREIALDVESRPTFNLDEMSLVRIARPLENAHQSQRIVYRIHVPHVPGVKSSDAAGVFLDDGGQTVSALEDGIVEVTVRALRPDQTLPVDFPGFEPVGDDDRLPNNTIQSEDSRIRAMAMSVAQEEKDPWRLAIALESLVHKKIQKKNFTQAFATAAEVVETLEGDCSEHAVLLAALCRARDIPARTAIGLVYFDREQAFAGHMWNEVWIHDRWIPLDATIGAGGIGAAHLKVSVSNLKGISPYSTFLPIIRLLGGVSLEIVEME